jgi:glutathione peroxidase
MATIYDTPVTALSGTTASLGDFRGKVLLIVNVASKCGFTPQYTGLEALHKRFEDRGFSVVGFPANNFAGQEPGSGEEIAKFCSTEYPVTFPVFGKLSVVGPDKHPLYRELIAAHPDRTENGNGLRNNLAGYLKSQGLGEPNAPPELLWNFEKFLVDRKGIVVGRFASDIAPDDPRLVEAIEKALGAA